MKSGQNTQTTNRTMYHIIETNGIKVFMTKKEARDYIKNKHNVKVIKGQELPVTKETKLN